MKALGPPVREPQGGARRVRRKFPGVHGRENDYVSAQNADVAPGEVPRRGHQGVRFTLAER